MPDRLVLLLRAVNLGARNKVPMARLRELLTERGYAGVRTFIASGNIIVDTDLPAAEVAADVHTLIGTEFGVETPVVVRTPADLRRVLAADPIPGAADDPKHYAVTFLDGPAPAAYERLAADAFPGEYVVVTDTEVFAWMPLGIHKSKLAGAVARATSAVGATARNWDTVRALADLAETDPAPPKPSRAAGSRRKPAESRNDPAVSRDKRA